MIHYRSTIPFSETPGPATLECGICRVWIIYHMLYNTPSAAAPNNKTHRYLCKKMFTCLKSGIKIRNSLTSVRVMMPVELRKGFWFFRAFSEIWMRPRDQGYPVVCVPELGLTSPPHSEAHVFDHHPRFFGSKAWRGGCRLNPDLVFCFAPKPRTFLARNASVLGVNFKWVFPTVGLSCTQLHSVTAMGWRPYVPAHEVLKGRKLKTESYMEPNRPIFSGSVECHLS